MTALKNLLARLSAALRDLMFDLSVLGADITGTLEA